MANKKILFIAPQPFYTERGTPINVRETVRVLGQSGYSIDLLVFPFGKEVFLPNVRLLRGLCLPGIQTVKIGPSWAKLVLDIPLFLQAAGRMLTGKYDLIHGVEEGGFMAWLLSRASGVPFIYDVDSNIPAQLKDSGFLRSDWMLQAITRLEKRCLTDATVVLSVCQALSDRATALAPSARIAQIEDFAIPEALRPDSIVTAEWKQRLALDQRKCILYTGNFEPYQGINLLLQAFALLKNSSVWSEQRPVLLLVGGGNETQLLPQLSGLKIGTDVFLTGQQPLKHMGSFLELADVLVSPRLYGENTPLKIYTYLAAQRPIVATDIDAHQQVFGEHTAYLSDTTPQAFADTIVRALEAKRAETTDQLQRISNAKVLATARYSFSAFRNRLCAVYQQTLGSTTKIDSATHATKKPMLVTGAGGFVGTQLVRELIEQGHHVRAMVRSNNQAGELEKLGAEVVYADLLDEESLRSALSGVSGVFHIAALFRKAGLPNERYWQINVEAVKRLLDLSRELGVERFIHCSTVGVHGDVVNPPANENSPYSPGDIYQQTKMEGEKIALDYFRSGLMRGAVIRPAMVYGPRDRRTLKLFKGVARQRFFYVGPGECFVHFVDVRDLARAFVQAMDAVHINAEVYIIAGKQALPLCDLVKIIASELGVRAPRIHLPVKPIQQLGDLCELCCKPFGIEPPIYRRRVDFFTKNRHFDWSKAQRDLHFSPAQSLENELRDILQSYISAGWIHPPSGQILGKNQQPTSVSLAPSSVMIRDMRGNILDWDSGAERVYGWRKTEAVGTVSHEILQTEFEIPLSTINAELDRMSRWQGYLIHTTRDGQKIRVASRWIHLPGSDQRIYEINQPIDETGNHKNPSDPASKTTKQAMGTFPVYLPELLDWIELGTLGISQAMRRSRKEPISL